MQLYIWAERSLSAQLNMLNSFVGFSELFTTLGRGSASASIGFHKLLGTFGKWSCVRDSRKCTRIIRMWIFLLRAKKLFPNWILERLLAVNIFNAFVANFLRKSLHVAPCQPKRASDTTTRFYIETLLAPKSGREFASCRVEFLLCLVVVAWVLLILNDWGSVWHLKRWCCRRFGKCGESLTQSHTCMRACQLFRCEVNLMYVDSVLAMSIILYHPRHKQRQRQLNWVIKVWWNFLKWSTLEQNIWCESVFKKKWHPGSLCSESNMNITLWLQSDACF